MNIAVDSEEQSAEERRSAIFDAAQTIRGFGRMFSELAADFADKVAIDELWHWRPAPSAWSALQHAAHFADLLASIAVDLAHLLDGEGRVHFILPAGPDTVSNELDPDLVLGILAGDAERVARLLESSPADPVGGAAFPITGRGVITTLALTAVRDGTTTLAAAHDVLTQAKRAQSSAPPATRTSRAKREKGVEQDDEAPVGHKSRLAESLADMSGLLFDEIALESLLQLVVSLARSTLDAADEASVSVVHAGVFETISATSPGVRDLDHVQYEFGRGPCVAATRSGERITTGFADDTGRWSEFSQAGLAAGFVGVLAIPLTVGTRRLGAVNLYSRTRCVFAAADADSAQVFADHAAVALANAVSFANVRVLNESLGDALKTRDLIGLAKGILMNRYGFSAAEAFDSLRRDSKRRNIALQVVAQEIIFSGQGARRGVGPR